MGQCGRPPLATAGLLVQERACRRSEPESFSSSTKFLNCYINNSDALHIKHVMLAMS